MVKFAKVLSGKVNLTNSTILRIGPSPESAPFANVNSIIISTFLLISHFENSYEEQIAEAFETQNSIQKLFKKRIKLLNGDYEVCSSVIFPELIRYSTLKKTFENYFLLKLYAHFGKEYGDFSVGLFQMKPTFIEKLEKDLESYSELHRLSFIWQYPEGINQSEIRKIRSERMIDLKWQIDYIISFILLLDHFYEKSKVFSKKQTKEEKIIIYSTSYNSGCWYDFDKVIQLSSLNYFPYGKYSFRNHINYSQVSSYYYRKMFKS